MQLRKILTIGLLSLGFAATPMISSTLRAEEPAKEQPKGKRGPGQYLEYYRATIDKLNITPEQKPTIDAAFADAKAKVDEITKDAGTDKAAIREKMQPIIKELTGKVAAVLTDEQKAQLKKPHEARQKPAESKDAK